ncbi:MAG TPA: hypothetical protein VEX39_04005 [Thermoleophilaceae bacterium]|nr:hypothetical protein [Thermoleophilaceae bacterium]
MSRRAIALPLAALVLAGALLGAYALAGGDDYSEVQGAADPCAARASVDRPVAPELEALAERVVLVGLDETACSLGVSRERLVLALPVAEDRRALAEELGISEDELGRELKAGLGRAVDRLDRAGRLPRASALLPAIVAELDLPGFAEDLVDAIPDQTVDSLVPTGPVLRRAVRSLDVQALLDGLGDSDQLESMLRDAVEEAAQEEIRARLLDELPESVRGLLGE